MDRLVELLPFCARVTRLVLPTRRSWLMRRLAGGLFAGGLNDLDQRNLPSQADMHLCSRLAWRYECFVLNCGPKSMHGHVSIPIALAEVRVVQVYLVVGGI